ncbi:MAG: type VI secretion system tube protein Hcp, partial [Xanthobacteraceae bacterium]|nr:type VI secretion system tube protein Hcp [Xanthobacteraceae bacterium]
MAQQLSGQVVLDSVEEDVKTTAVVATFTDANTSDPAGSFAATVNWGDGTTEAATVTGANGSFAVSVPDSTHVYTDEGTDPITVTITGTAGGNIAPANLRYFLAIDGLNGGSTDAAHVGWFDVSSFDIGALVAAITNSKTFSPLNVTLPSTGLTGVLADLVQGTPIKSVRLEGVTTNGQAVYDLTLGNVSVSNYADAPGGDQLSVSYQQVALTTTAVNPDGSVGTSQSFSWDLTQNQPAAPIPAPTPNTAGSNIAPGNLHYFLAIDGLDGGSKDAAHVGWFDVSSYDVGALAAAMTGSATFSPLSITFASTGLTDVLADLANGRTIKSVRLEGVTSTGQAAYDLTLGNVSVNNYADAATGAQLSFSYQQVALTTTSSNSDGSTGNSQTFSWDLTQDKSGVSISAPTPSTVAGNIAPNNLDYFLAIDGIDGESTDRNHENWFQVSNYDLGALTSATGLPTFGPLTVTFHSSGLTGLLADLPTSTLIRSVRLEGVTRGTNAQAVYDLTLGNVRVGDYQDTSSGNTLTFNYQLMDLTTRATNPDGSLGNSQTFSWDRLNNVPLTSPIPAPTPGSTPGEAVGSGLTYFLAIDGLNGGATDVHHAGWFDVSSYDFGAQIAALTPGSKLTFSPLTVTLPTTGSTGVLADLLDGTTLPPPNSPNSSYPIASLRLEGVASNGQAVYDLTLGNVTVTSYDGAAGGDKLSFSYQQVALTTTPRNPDGSLGTPLSFGWDVARDTGLSNPQFAIPAPAPTSSPVTAGNVAPDNLHYFLAIDGVNGGSTDAAHIGWFDVSSYDFAAQLAATGSLATFSPLSVTLPSTGLTGVLADLTPGTDIRSVRLEGVNNAGQAVYDLTLGNATVTNYTDAPAGNQLSFNYQQVSLTTRAVNTNGSLGTSQTSAWDIAHNVALAGSIPTPTPGTVPGNVAPAHLHYFLAIDGLNGGSTDAAHAGWFDVSSYEFDVKDPAGGRAAFSPLSVTLPSTGTTRVVADLAQLSTLSAVRLEGVTDSGQAVYDLTLGNVAVTKYNDASSGAQLSFSYQQVALTTTAINSNGSLGSSQSFSWDVPHNAPAGSIPPPVPNTASGQIAPTRTVTVTEG